MARSTSPDSRRGQWPPAPHSPPCARQVNMAIGILVFNRLVSKDGIADHSQEERTGPGGVKGQMGHGRKKAEVGNACLRLRAASTEPERLFGWEI